MKPALAQGPTCQENRSERPISRGSSLPTWPTRRPIDSLIRLQFVGNYAALDVQPGKNPRRASRPTFKPPRHIIPLGEVVGGAKDVARRHRTGHASMRISIGKEADFTCKRTSAHARTAGGNLSRDALTHRKRRAERRGDGCRGSLWTGPSWGVWARACMEPGGGAGGI